MSDGQVIKVPRYCTEEQTRRWAAVRLPLDQYGETPRFLCAGCGSPDGMKVSVPIELGHCVDCGMNRRDEDVLRALERQHVPERIDVDVEVLSAEPRGPVTDRGL